MAAKKTQRVQRHIVQVEADGEQIANVELLAGDRADALADAVLHAVEQRAPVRIDLSAVDGSTEQSTGTMVFDPAGCTTVIVRRFTVSDTGGAANFKR